MINLKLSKNKFLVLFLCLAIGAFISPRFTYAKHYYNHYRINPGKTMKIDEWGECRMVKNQSGYPAVFIPTRTQTEWDQFRIYHPSHVHIQN